MGLKLEKCFFVFISSLGVVFLSHPRLLARPCRPALIPNGTVNGCANCHLNPRGGGVRNAFGKTVEPLVKVGMCDPFWGPEIAAMDSDGDGIPNGVELQDPEGTWTSGKPPPGEPTLVTNAGLPNVEFIRADPDGDGTVSVADAIVTLKALFEKSGPFPCDASADANGDARINIVDPVFTLQKLFVGGPEPPPPFPQCALASKGLPCQSYRSCGR